MALSNTAANAAPINGPTTGTQLYPQSALAFNVPPRKRPKVKRGPRSRAGLFAEPVVPPKLKPIAQTKIATGNAPIEPKPIGVLSAVPGKVMFAPAR